MRYTDLSSGTLADALRRFLPLALDAEISRHLSEAPVVHGDETGWWIRELNERGSGSARAWAGRSEDAVRILPSRSGEATLALFGSLGSPEQADHLIRYSAYRKLARIMEGHIVLSYCHARRHFVNLGNGYPNLAPFARKWIRHIAALYRLNARRGNAIAERWLAGAVEAFFAKAEKERNDLPEGDPRRAPLDSLLRHRDGLTTFVNNAATDNNAAERGLRGIAIGLSFGSVDGARLAGMLHSVFGTLEGVSPYRWLLDGACARHRGPPPEDPAA